MAKIKGFNEKEQRIFNKMKDGEEHDFRALKKLFWEDAKARCKDTYEKGWGEAEIDAQAQSFARNSIRRLIRDGWVKQIGRGTYKLTPTGKNRVEKGTDTTPSALTSHRGRPKADGSKPKKARAKKEKPAKAAKPKKVAKAAKPNKGKKVQAKAKAKKTSTKKLKAMKAKVNKEATKERTVAKAKKASAKASKENGHNEKVKKVAARAAQAVKEETAAAATN